MVLYIAQALIILYFTALYISVAGMEMSAWLTVAFTGIYLALAKKKLVVPPRGPLISSLVLWAIVLLGLVINEVPAPFFAKAAMKFRWAILLFMLYNFYIHFFDEKFFQKLFVWIDVIVVIVFVYCAWQFVHGQDLFRPYSITFRPLTDGSPFFRPNGFFSLTLTLTYCISMYFCVGLARLLHRWEKPFSLHAIHMAGLLSSLIIILMSFTRGGWLALFITIIVLLVLYDRRLLKYFAGIFTVVFTSLWFFFPMFKEKIYTVFDMNYINNVERLNLWKANWEIAKEHPWFGLGFLQNSRLIQPYLALIGQPNSYRSHAHNNFLDFQAGTGIFGLTAFLLFIGTSLWFSIKAYRYLKHSSAAPVVKAIVLGGIGAQLIMHIGGLTECTFKDAELNHQFMVLLALIFCLHWRETQRNAHSLSPP